MYYVSKDTECAQNVTLRRFRVTIVAEEKSIKTTYSECSRRFRYPTCKFECAILSPVAGPVLIYFFHTFS